MVSLLLRFPGGRYHATPWGHHVNEGLVEYPPSPWRILRALLATGYAKLGWASAPPEAVELVHALAAVLPVYRLPPATGAHTRHYMPVHEGKKVTKTKVIDAFARVDATEPLSVTWDTRLSSAAEGLLRDLVVRLGYLGRAESVVSVQVLEDEDLPRWPETRADRENAPDLEPIALLAPLSAPDYAAWCASVSSESQSSNDDRDDPRKRGRKKKPETDPYPSDLISALQRDTAWLQRRGWTQPPGSRCVIYWRPAGVLGSAGPIPVRRVATTVVADTALLALASDTSRGEVLPLFSRALAQAELLHRSLIALLGDPAPNCPELAGKSEQGVHLTGHRHAHFVPLDRDGDGRLDHVLVHAPMGLGAAAQGALRHLRKTWTKGGDRPLFVTLAGMGMLKDFVQLAGERVPELAQARRWVSRTPFVPPRYVKHYRHTVADQVRAELRSRDLPEALSVTVSDARVGVGQGFHRFLRTRRHPAPQPPSTAFFHVSLELESPVEGPILLGYASHFGLGLFVPAE